jgi:cell cycle sensor histidine kinase DivJ
MADHDTENISSDELKMMLEIMDYQASTKDLSVRMPAESGTGADRIARHYNKLIEALEVRTQEQENLVSQRTAQISRINNALANEVMDRKIAEYALADSLQKAKATNQTKSAFLANMSHELRTPLNSIIGFSEMIQHEVFGKLDHQHYTDYITAIHQSGNHLLTLINTVLDLSKIEADAMLLEEEIIDIPGLFAQSVQLVRNMIDRKHLSLSMDIPQNFPPLYCDSLRINQVLINLLSNAIKFTPKGGDIIMGVTLETNNGITLKISDTGIGIAENKQKEIFEPFAQVENSETSRTQGTGLGLALVHSFVELHDGRIGIDSIEGTGTTIYIFFPSRRTMPRKS